MMIELMSFLYNKSCIPFIVSKKSLKVFNKFIFYLMMEIFNFF